jgi:hypothetical protein
MEYKLGNGWLPLDTPAAWLVTVIQSGDWVIPEWFRTPEEREVEAQVRRRQATKHQERLRQEEEQERHEAQTQRQSIEQSLGVDAHTCGIWDQARSLLRSRKGMSSALLTAYLLPISDATATIVMPVEYFCRVIERDAELIRGALEEVSGRVIKIIEAKHVALA